MKNGDDREMIYQGDLATDRPGDSLGKKLVIQNELIEEVGLANAMFEAEDSEVVSEKEVMKVLKG